METKLFEMRAAATNIPVLAVRLNPTNAKDTWLLGRAGYGMHGYSQAKYIMVMKLEGEPDASTQEYSHESHAMQVTQKYLNEHFDDLESGAVIDTQFIEGKTFTPVESDMFRMD
jgi:hypothetical protein